MSYAAITRSPANGHAADNGATIRPVGRQEVMAAVLEAGTELFSERGPDAVTVREVADRAGVNHALIHRHYGTKDELLRVVLVRAVERMDTATRTSSEAGPDLAPVVAAVRHEEQGVRLLAWAILSGYPVDQIWPDNPAIRHLQAVLGDEQQAASGAGNDRTDPRVAVATATALLLGWIVFRPFLERAGGLDDLPGFDEDLVLERAVHDLVDLAP